MDLTRGARALHHLSLLSAQPFSSLTVSTRHSTGLRAFVLGSAIAIAGCQESSPSAPDTDAAFEDTALDLGADAESDALDIPDSELDAADGSDGEPDLGPIPNPGAVEAERAEPRMYRLTQAQYRNSVRDIFGDVVLPVALEPDVESAGFFSVGAGSATISARGVEQYERAAYDIAGQVVDVDRRGALACAPNASDDRACFEAILGEAGGRLWRRPLSSAELSLLADIAEGVANSAEDPWVGVEYGLATLLQSPWFLFRAESGVDGAAGERTLTEWELAAKLSYFLWNTTPDDELLQAAAAGQLTSDAGWREQAERLLASERARVGLRNFFSEYFRLNELDELRKDPDEFTHFSPELGPSAREETLMLIEHLIFDEPQDYRNLLTTHETFLNRTLAALYDQPAPSREGFGVTTLPEDGARRGLLGHASVLALHSHPISTSATLRGEFVRETLLCGVIPPPPANVDTSIPEPSADAPTLRERVAVHLEADECAGCHLLMDPIGLGLENFDAIGRFRSLETGAMIDPSGDLDGAAFGGPAQLAEAVAGHPDFARCFVENLFRYATGHLETNSEEAVIDALTEWWERAEGRQVQPLLLEVVMNPSFRNVEVAE